MKKRICAVLALCFYLFVFAMPVLASGEDEELLSPVWDNQYVFGTEYFTLTDEELDLLNDQAARIAISSGVDVLIVRDDALSVDISTYASDLFAVNGKSSGGIVLALGGGQWYIGTYGENAPQVDEEGAQNLWASFTAGQSDYQCISGYLTAAGELLGVKMIPDERLLPRLVDNADLLSSREEESVLALLDEISERQRFDVVVVTVDTLDGEYIMNYADDFFDYNGYGFGEDGDGVLLLVDMGSRECWISTCGYGLTAIDDYGIEYMLDEFVPYLSDAEYEEGFTTFANLCDDFVTQAKTGEPYTRGNLPSKPLSGAWIPGSLFIGAIPSLAITSGMKSKLKTVRTKLSADSYADRSGSTITGRNDLFLYRNVTRSARVQESSSRSGGGGSHFGSSGRSHGGGGRGF